MDGEFNQALGPAMKCQVHKIYLLHSSTFNIQPSKLVSSKSQYFRPGEGGVWKDKDPGEEGRGELSVFLL